MARSFPIPGEILDTGDFFGLSYDQLIIIGFLPIIVMMFSFVIGFIPTWFSLILGLITALIVGVVVAKSPDGQDPFEWAGAALKRRFQPKRYTLKPTSSGRQDATVIDVIHTAETPGTLSEEVTEKIENQQETESDTNSAKPLESNNR